MALVLASALDIGLSEVQFWGSTIAELERLAESYERREQARLKERAAYDYIHAALIGRAMSASERAPFPALHEAYPSLFSGEAEEQAREEQRAQLSALRFIQFAQSHNKNFVEEANKA